MITVLVALNLHGSSNTQSVKSPEKLVKSPCKACEKTVKSQWKPMNNFTVNLSITCAELDWNVLLAGKILKIQRVKYRFSVKTWFYSNDTVKLRLWTDGVSQRTQWKGCGRNPRRGPAQNQGLFREIWPQILEAANPQTNERIGFLEHYELLELLQCLGFQIKFSWKLSGKECWQSIIAAPRCQCQIKHGSVTKT
jgi:hypothetical protein